MKDILSNPHVLSIMISVIGRENSSLGKTYLWDKRHLGRKVDANLDLSVLLRDRYDVGNPVRMLFFPDESRDCEI